MARASRFLSRRSFLSGLIVTGAALTACGATPPRAGAPAEGSISGRATPPVAISVPTVTSATAEAGAAKASAGVKRGGLLRVHRQNDWPTMDPHTSQASNLEAPLVFDYLTKIERNASTGIFEVKPSLADAWEIVDPTTVVFKLRRGVKFHDGTDFNAEAASWNLDRIMKHPKSAGKNHLATVESIQVMDTSTLRLKLKAPSPALFFNLSSDADSVAGMISRVHAEKVGDAGVSKEPVGTGPFRFVEWKPSDHVSYRRRDGYWKNGADGKPLPYIDDVQVVYQPDWSVAVVQLRTGNLDLLSDIGGKDVPAIKSNPALVYREAPWQATTHALCFNARPGARFAGDKMKKVRQAIFYAIDRESTAKALGLDSESPRDTTWSRASSATATKFSGTVTTPSRPSSCWPKRGSRTAWRSLWTSSPVRRTCRTRSSTSRCWETWACA